MSGFIPQIQEKNPNLKVTRTRINAECVKVVRVNTNALTVVDPKGDYSLIEKAIFHCNGQLPFGEWLKKLGENDTPPRGACRKYFAKHNHLKVKAETVNENFL